MATDTTTQQIVDVVTPAAGESVTEGTILEWHVKVGEQIEADDTIVEISTDKVDVELPSPATGTVTEILVAEGDTVTVGQVIARIAVGGGAAAPASVAPETEAAERANGASEPAAERSDAAPDGNGNGAGAPAAEPSGERPASSTFVTPAAGESVSEGTILEWHAKVGDPIKANDTIVEISTDKVDVELPAPATGTVTEILVAEGDTVTVGQVIARIAVGAGAATPAPESAEGPGASAPAATPAQAPDGTRVSPVAARAAAAEGVDLARSQGSGPAGRITKSDVLDGRQRQRRGERASRRRRAGQRTAACAAARRRSPATWTSRARSRPRPASGRITVTTLDGRRQRAQGGPAQGLLHPPDRLRDRARGRARCR